MLASASLVPKGGTDTGLLFVGSSFAMMFLRRDVVTERYLVRFISVQRFKDSGGGTASI